MTPTPSSIALEPQTKTAYTIDLSHSTAQFKVRHLGFSKVTGRFTDFAGTLHLDPARLDTIDVEAVLQAASVTTGDAKRDDHLRSADFFDAEAFPALSFSGSEVRDVDGATFKLAGTLTIRGVTRPIVLDVVYQGQATDPWGGERVAFEARTKINRTDFGLTWNTILETGGLLVAEEVEIMLDIQAVKQQTESA